MTVQDHRSVPPVVDRFVSSDGSHIPFEFFHSDAIYALEQERIFRGPTWNFLGLEAEIPAPCDFKSTFIGDTPVVMTRTAEGKLAAWVNRCAHRGAQVCRMARGNAASHTCVYHQWSYDPQGNLEGVPFRKGHKGSAGMPKGFNLDSHGLQTLRVESYRGLVFATFDETLEPLADYIGPEMRPLLDRIFSKPVEYLGSTRQYSQSNWKLYLENVKDPYHASLLHLFHTTFNIFRVGMRAELAVDARHGLHSAVLAIADGQVGADVYRKQSLRSYDEGFGLQDPSILDLVEEFDVATTNHIQPIFPQLIVQQIHNTLVARQLLPKGPGNFELVFHYFGYSDDSPEMRALRIKQANLVGPGGYISMEDTEATELVQRGTASTHGRGSFVEMGIDTPEERNTLISEELIRRFWRGYAAMMGLDASSAEAVTA